ncbi:MAG TPA: fatty acid desaturase, partial [Steroidobacteraceae bacterium]
MTDAPSIASGGAIPPSPMPKTLVAAFQNSSASHARWQLINSFIPYLALWYGMYRALTVSYWLMLPIAILAAGFLVRIFIIFHDCGHSSFFKSRTANNVTGAIAGLLNLTPYRHWRWQHALHHGSAGNLDQRGTGDIWTLTVQEFRDASRWTRLTYRLARNPLILFLIAPLFVFVIHQHFASSSAPPRERRSVHGTNLALLLT